MKFSVLLCAGLLLASLAPARAQDKQEKLVIYRCTDASGALTIQNNEPCPKGSKQDKRVVDGSALPSAPPFPLAPSAPAATPAASPERNRPLPRPVAPPVPAEELDSDDERLPPPALFECRTPDNDSYLSENGEPQPRCVPINTTGLSGTIENSNVLSACEMKVDVCQRVPDGALCDGWRKRQRQAESAVRFGASDTRAKAQDEFQRISRVVSESTCGRP